MKTKTVLCVVAHAGDLEFMAGGTVIRFAEKGYKLYEVIATRSDKGSYELSSAELVAASEHETIKAAEVLALDDVIFLRHEEGRLSDLPLSELREEIMRVIRQVHPDVLMTWDPVAPYEISQDRRIVGMAAAEAADVAALPSYHPEHMEQGLEPHYVGERYYFGERPTQANKIVDISEQVDRKIEALCQHESRMKFLLDGVKIEAEAAGIHLPSISGLRRDNYRELVEAIIHKRCAEIGKEMMLPYAEAFRYEAFDKLKLLAPDEVKRIADF